MGAFLFWTGASRGIATLLLSILWLAAPSAAEPVSISRVLDGDSLVLTDGREVRLIGINAPEFTKDSNTRHPLAIEARAALAALIAGRPVTLVHEAQRHDRYNRELAHIYLANGDFVGERLLEMGMAWLVAVPPNIARLPALKRAEETARRARRGVWSEPHYQPMPAPRISADETGFRFVSGRITSVGEGAQAFYLDLDGPVTLRIARDHWDSYFVGALGEVRQPRELRGRSVIARGWLSRYKDTLRMRIAHPAMLTFADE